MHTNNLETEFINNAIFRMNENTPRIKKCFVELTEKEIWERPNPSSNSIGNLVLHICGNITQYIISGLGGAADNRQRDAEFTTSGGFSKSELLDDLTKTVNKANNIMLKLTRKDLQLVRSVQGFELSGMGITMHVVEHYSYHTGQIAFYTKLLKEKDLGFYANLDLNVKNIG